MIRLLDRAKAIGILESVKDESHFWDNRDVKALVETVGKWNSRAKFFSQSLRTSRSAPLRIAVRRIPL